MKSIGATDGGGSGSSLILGFLSNHPRRPHTSTITPCPNSLSCLSTSCIVRWDHVGLSKRAPCTSYPYPPVPTPANSEETCRPSYTPKSIPVEPPKARLLVSRRIRAKYNTKSSTYKLKGAGDRVSESSVGGGQHPATCMALMWPLQMPSAPPPNPQAK